GGAAGLTAWRPEPHTLLPVKAGTVSGSPAFSAACRAGFWPTPAWMTLPRMTSSTRSAGTRARFSTSATAVAPSCGAGTSARAPRYLPMGVRAADSRKASLMCVLLEGRAELPAALYRDPSATAQPGLPPTPQPGAPATGWRHPVAGAPGWVLVFFAALGFGRSASYNNRYSAVPPALIEPEDSS